MSRFRLTPNFRLLTAALCLASAVSLPAQITAADQGEAVSSTLLRTEDGVPTRLARESPVLILYMENDYFGGTDQHYTNGFKAAWLSPDLTGWGKSGWRQSFLERLPFVNEEKTQKNLGLAVAQHIYTPQDISRSNPDPTDRPYAGWTYFEFSFLAKNDAQADTVAVQIGMVGPHSYAEDIQKWAHGLIDGEIPQGWDYQLHDELGVNIAWERKWRTYARTVTASDRFGLRTNPFTGKSLQDRPHWGIDFVPHLGAVVGNVSTYANVGATTRFGFNLPSDFGVNMIRPAGVASSPIDDLDPRVRGACWSVFLFGGADGRAVARNIFLDGNTFKDSRHVEREPLVYDLSYGLGVARGAFQLTFTKIIRSREFEGQIADNNKFGSLTTSWIF
ncbi:lipid A deacylase LpxR family protein [Synoicihabitans lomoniglobus]|uniref:Lipid A deacylase LpxR family protein n=1 Tax=Synoicihabitans lomoniglobus TaxID=2909285 RepID=A0AAF0CPH1_9BACT|nr:lipid A deacylase LpxR family protein [Opitutaceae bacterium LMO-M01]WED64714.1 lipid A deacylase LpxR family protein [Opitutaceae bacterium LMO-M01]